MEKKKLYLIIEQGAEIVSSTLTGRRKKVKEMRNALHGQSIGVQDGSTAFSILTAGSLKSGVTKDGYISRPHMGSIVGL